MGKELCKGCSINYKCTILNTKISAKHAMDIWKEIPNCPCGKCIVKSMCKNNQCQDYLDYSHMIQQIMIHGKGEYHERKENELSSYML